MTDLELVIERAEVAEKVRDEMRDRLVERSEALKWIQEFASKSLDQHSGYVWIERHARTALASRVSWEAT